MLQRNHSDVIDDAAAAAAAAAGGESMIGGTASHDSGNGVGGENMNKSEGESGVMNWQNARNKAEILAHPLYDQLLSAHVACLRIATPVDQLPRIDAQLAQSQNVVAKYSALGQGLLAADDKDLDQFMVYIHTCSLAFVSHLSNFLLFYGNQN